MSCRLMQSVSLLKCSSRSLSTSPRLPAWFFSKEAERSAGHSSLISKDNSVYEIVSERVVPKHWQTYLKQKQDLINCINSSPDIKAEHIASWNLTVGGNAFQTVHLFKYNGWEDIDDTRAAVKKNEDYLTIDRSGFPFLTEKQIELTKNFSFWPSPDARPGDNVYDIRCYSLKPGSMYDWSNYWAKGIKSRSAVRNDVPYAGLFTQLGQLHTIYHIWCYKSLADRKLCRENTWAHPEWNDVVANTVPLVNTMSTTIAEPLPFSPTK